MLFVVAVSHCESVRVAVTFVFKYNMEVLDPSVTRDDLPLCVNDYLEKGTFIMSYIRLFIYVHLFCPLHL